MQTTKSILIVGFPKGCTTLATQVLSKACSLRLPECGKAELLNADCNVEFRNPHMVASPDAFEDATDLLTRYSVDHVVKDVVQPWLTSAYLMQSGFRYNVVYLQRSRDELKKCQLREGWDCPDPAYFEEMYLQLADAVLTAEELLTRPERVWEICRSLGYAVTPHDYTSDSEFQAKLRDTQAFLLS